MENLDLLSNDLQVTPTTQSFLSETAKWGKFLAILGFIMCGFLAIMAFFMPAIFLSLPQYNQLSSGLVSGMTIGITIAYLLLALLCLMPCIYLYKFSVKMKTALTSVSQENFEKSLQNLKSLFKFYGVFSIVMLSIYALVFIISIVGAAFR